MEYEIWFDTKDYFGNGEYQIYNNPSDSYALINMKYNVAVIDNVANYMKKNNKVFFKGYMYNSSYIGAETNIFSVLNTDDNKLKYYVVDGEYNDYLILHSEQLIEDNKLIIIDDFNDFEEDEQKELLDL